MRPEPRSPVETYAPALEAARHDFQRLDPQVTAWKASVSYKDGVFQVPFFSAPYQVTWPAGDVYQISPDDERTPVSVTTSIVMLHYLIHAAK